MTADDTKVFAHETLRSPVGQGHDASRATDAKEFGGRPLGTRSEHDPKHTDDEIEGGVRIGESFGIALGELDDQVLPLGAATGLRDQVGGKIQAVNDTP